MSRPIKRKLKKKRRITGENQKNRKIWENLRQRGVRSIDTLGDGGLVSGGSND